MAVDKITIKIIIKFCLWLPLNVPYVMPQEEFPSIEKDKIHNLVRNLLTEPQATHFSSDLIVARLAINKLLTHLHLVLAALQADFLFVTFSYPTTLASLILLWYSLLNTRS